MRRRRGFRSYVASTLALPHDAVAALTLVGTNLAAPLPTSADAALCSG